MRAGKLRHRIAVDKPVVVRDDTGDSVSTWVTQTIVWGSIEHLNGRETMLASQITADMTTRITLRWSNKISNLNPKWRLRHGNTVYSILSALNVEEKNESFLIIANSGKNTG